MTDAGLDKIKGMASLKELFVYGTKVTDEGVKKLKTSLPKLKTDKDIPPVKAVTEPAKKEEMKKTEPAKKEEAKKKEEPKKDAPKKDEPKKKVEAKKEEPKKDAPKKDEPKKKA